MPYREPSPSSLMDPGVIGRNLPSCETSWNTKASVNTLRRSESKRKMKEAPPQAKRGSPNRLKWQWRGALKKGIVRKKSLLRRWYLMKKNQYKRFRKSYSKLGIKKLASQRYKADKVSSIEWDQPKLFKWILIFTSHHHFCTRIMQRVQSWVLTRKTHPPVMPFRSTHLKLLKIRFTPSSNSISTLPHQTSPHMTMAALSNPSNRP
jgi:hypothetical protein